MTCLRTICTFALFALSAGAIAIGPGAGGGDTGSAMRKLASFVDRSEEAMEICEGQSSFVDCVNSYSNDTVKLDKASCFQHLHHEKVICNARNEQQMEDFSKELKTCYVNIARTMCSCDSEIFTRDTSKKGQELYLKAVSKPRDVERINNKDNTLRE